MSKKSAPAQAATQDDELPQTAVKPRGKDVVIQTLQEQLAAYAEPSAPVDDPPEPAATTPEEETFKKRYGDLRRHAQQKETLFTKQINDLKSQMEQLTKAANQPMPKNKEEFETWKSKYPQIASFVETIADEKASEKAAQLNIELDGVKQKLTETEKEKAFATLKVLVPDIEDLVRSLEYKNWYQEQPAFVQEELNTSEDPHRIAYWVNIYRMSVAKPEKQAKKPGDKLAALDTSVKNTGAKPDHLAGKYKFTASQIAKMTPAEFEKHEQELIEARNAGQILDDLSKRNTVWDI